MDEDRELIGDLDCPSLLCEELGDFDNGDNDQGRRSREGGGEEEESLSQDEKGGQEQEQEENGEEEGGNKVSSVLEENLIEIGGEEEEWRKPTSGPKAGEPQEGQMEDKIENDEGTISDKQEDKETNGLEEKDVQKKSRKRRGKKQSERARSKRSVKDVSERVEGEKKSQMQELPEMSPEEGLSLPEPPVGLMNSCDLSDSVYLSCGGAGLYCPPVPIPLLYSAQRQVPIQPAPPQPHGTKRLHSPPLPHPLPQPAPQPLEMEITQVYSTRRSIRYSTRGRGRTLEFPLLPGLEPVDSCLLPPAPKKKTRTLYSTDQLEHLEGLFQEDHYPDAEKRRIIAATVGVTPQRIMVWFQNRRAKWRKAERSVTGKGEHRPSRTGLSSSPHQTNPALPAQAAPTSKGAGSLTGHVGPKPPPPLRPAAPPLHTQTLPSYSTLLACITSPCQSRARDGVQHQPSSQGGAAEYQPPPMHSPPPLRRASLSLFTPNYNPVNPTSNPTPPFLNTPSHTPPLFLDALEGSSSLSHRDTQSLQTDTSSLFDYGERLEYLTSSQQNNTLSYQLQTSYPPSQPQTQASLPRLAYLTPSPYLTPNPPDSNPTSYLTFGPGGGSTGVVTYAAAGGHAYYQSQSAGQILLQSTGHHGGITAYQSYPWGNMYSQPAMLQRAQCPPAYSGGGLGAARDHQTPSTTPLAGPPFFSRASYGPSHADVQHSSHTQAHTTTTTSSSSSSSSTAVLPPVSTLRPSRLRAESAAPSQVIAASPESPPAPSCVKIEYDSPGEIHSHFHCDFSPIHF